MGELIRIGAQEGAPGLGATIDTTGAWVTELSTGKDHVFFPRDLVPVEEEFKLRGGMHICSPYFGQDPDGRGPQHGFARDVEWEIAGSGRMYVRLRNIATEGEYVGLQHDIGIQVVDLAHIKMLATNLTIINNGKRAFAVTPAFHPYFSGPAKFGECKPVAEEDTRLKILSNYSSRVVQLLSGISADMVNVNLPNSVVWSDIPKEYHCIEPSVTQLSQGPSLDDRLDPGDNRSYSVNIIVKA